MQTDTRTTTDVELEVPHVIVYLRIALHFSKATHSLHRQRCRPTSSAGVSPAPRLLTERWNLLHSIPETVLISGLACGFYDIVAFLNESY